MASDKIFCGSGREKETKHGPMHKLSFSRKDIAALVAQLGQGEWVNADMFRRREPKDGVTHYLVIDTWKPTPREQPAQQTEESPF